MPTVEQTPTGLARKRGLVGVLLGGLISWRSSQPRDAASAACGSKAG